MDEFKQFSFGGDFQLQMEGSSYSELTKSGPDETGAACSTGRPEQKTRKRKIDKDGFVTPATPDIPKSSSHYGESSHDDPKSTSDDMGNGFPAEDENPSGFCSNADLVEQNTEAHPNNFNSDLQQDSMFLRDSTRSEETESNVSASTGSVQDLVKEFEQEAKLLHTQWAETFKESEDFELLCSNTLDSYTEEAKRLETTLNRQKDVLFHRLHGLGKTLQM